MTLLFSFQPVNLAQIDKLSKGRAGTSSWLTILPSTTKKMSGARTINSVMDIVIFDVFFRIHLLFMFRHNVRVKRP